MERKDESKETDIKNHTCYYFGYIMRVIDIDLDNILSDIKSYKTYENILIYNISYKTFMGSKPLRIWFEKIDGFIKIYDGIRYLVLFASERCNAILTRIKYLISERSGITDSINHNFARIRTDSYKSLPIEKILGFHNVLILIKSVVNKNKNDYYSNIFLEKGSYEDKSNIYIFKINVCISSKLYFDRVDLSERIYLNKTSESKECDILLLLFLK